MWRGRNALLTAQKETTVQERHNLRFFETGHWLIGMGHDPGTFVQAATGDALFQITGKRIRDLPYGKHDLTWS